MFGILIILKLKVIFLGDFSFANVFLIELSCYHDNYFKYFMFGKYNGFVSKARVSACMYFLVLSRQEKNYKALPILVLSTIQTIQCVHTFA
jgi:hypothetical protein